MNQHSFKNVTTCRSTIYTYAHEDLKQFNITHACVITYLCMQKSILITECSNNWGSAVYVIPHKKIGATYTPSHYYTYLIFSVSHSNLINYIEFPIACYTNSKIFIGKPHVCLGTKLWNCKTWRVAKSHVHISLN